MPHSKQTTWASANLWGATWRAPDTGRKTVGGENQRRGDMISYSFCLKKWSTQNDQKRDETFLLADETLQSLEEEMEPQRAKELMDAHWMLLVVFWSWCFCHPLSEISWGKTLFHTHLMVCFLGLNALTILLQICLFCDVVLVMVLQSFCLQPGQFLNCWVICCILAVDLIARFLCDVHSVSTFDNGWPCETCARMCTQDTDVDS